MVSRTLHTSLLAVSLAMWLAWTAAACGGGNPAGTPDTSASRDLPREVLADLPGPPDARQDRLADHREVSAEDTPAPELPPPKKSFMEPCESNDECDVGFCVLAPGQKVCTKYCLSDCPRGWTCEPYATGSDPIYICQSTHWALCQPCVDESDCKAAGDKAISCLSYGLEGRYCGGKCYGDNTCPDGYACREVPGIHAEPSLQCVRVEGTCECLPYYQGLATLCERTNEYGTCTAERTCTAGGYSACEPRTPGPELCDRQDNDCDGDTDEDLDYCCTCGDGKCEAVCGEDAVSCPCDCKACGDDLCSPCGESPQNCKEDCCGGCGDGRCRGFACGESAATCPEDCGAPCGNGACESGESPQSCAADCHWRACGNGVCEPSDGGPENCPSDCAATCGDCLCEGGEDWLACPGDCGYCGDGVCSPCDRLHETPESCQKDCGPNVEACDRKDNDEDGETDEEGATGCLWYHLDLDRDGAGLPEARCLCRPEGDHVSANQADCDDRNPDIRPGALEVCNGTDDDCDGSTDPRGSVECVVYHQDEDRDGWGRNEGSRCQCRPEPPWDTQDRGDCNDSDFLVHPGMEEACNAVDDDCSGVTDGILQPCLTVCGGGQETCLAGVWQGCDAPRPARCTDWLTCLPIDSCDGCEPAPQEACNAVDDDCDGVTDGLDSPCSTACGSGSSRCTLGKWAECSAPKPLECLDYQNCGPVTGCPPCDPPPPETCNGLDDDCNGSTDDGIPCWLGDGAHCLSGDECQSGHCGDGFCCSEGECCATEVDCTVPDACSTVACRESRCEVTGCDDGDPCTDDSCQGTLCTHAPRTCPAAGDPCRTLECSPLTGNCDPVPEPDATPCDRDGLACTIDACAGGSCTFQQIQDCSGSADDCHAGSCEEDGGGAFRCVKDPLPDGTPCTDEPDPCTEDRCVAGLCQHTALQNCNGPCGGQHAFDAGDDLCGSGDACVGGLAGYPNGTCQPVCSAPGCQSVTSGILDLPVDERIGCTTAPLEVSTADPYVAEVAAKVRLSHGYLGDLAIDIVDPQGLAHRLWNHIGGANQDFANTFDLSFPVPYPGIPTSGVPLCSLKGEQPAGTWYLKVCDEGAGNEGILHEWSLHLRTGVAPDQNPGHRCSDAIDLGANPVVPAIQIDGTTRCSLNSVGDTGCGGELGPDRLYKFTLTAPRRVTARLFQPDRDLILFLKEADGETCASGSLECAQSFGAGANPEIIDRQMQPGVYYLGIDTAGGPYDQGDFRFEIRIQNLLPDGADCVGDLGPQDLDCLGTHCQNGFCCTGGDCCPGDAWAVPADGADPDRIRTDPAWISADAACPVAYKEPAICHPTAGGINTCQGERHDANCVDHVCVKTRVDDDTACNEAVLAEDCSLSGPVYCGDTGPFPPGAQVKPACPTTCATDSDCDPEAHCDPAVATDPDQTVAPFTMTCQSDRGNGSTCNESSDCLSGHCQNGFCCDSGDCCPSDDVPGALACPAPWTVAPVCDDSSACQGHRYDPVCSNHQCATTMVRDDCACSGLLSDNCGLAVAVHCNAPPSATCPATEVGGGEWIAGDPACGTDCLTGGLEDDTKCDDLARCDPCTQQRADTGDCQQADVGTAVCQGNMPNGYPCDEASDCANKLYLPPTGPDGGHCQNGFCCDSGDCCGQETDCPIPTPASDYWAPPVCDDVTTCQGHRQDATCISSVCGTRSVDDDTACTYDPMLPSDDCGFYKPVYCNGEPDQVDPPCPTTCLVTGAEDDTLCDDNAHCDPDILLPNQINSICLEDLVNDDFCDEAGDCISAYCQTHFCCDAGNCCAGCLVESGRPVLAAGGSAATVTNGTVTLTLAVGRGRAVSALLEGDAHGLSLGLLATAVIPIHCADGARNITETDVDCGGGTCPQCSPGKECRANSDCASNDCRVIGMTSRCQ